MGLCGIAALEVCGVALWPVHSVSACQAKGYLTDGNATPSECTPNPIVPAEGWSLLLEFLPNILHSNGTGSGKVKKVQKVVFVCSLASVYAATRGICQGLNLV